MKSDASHRSPKVGLSARCLYARVARFVLNQSSREKRRRARASEREARRARVRYDRLPWRAHRWLAVDRARRDTPSLIARDAAARRGVTRPGSARGIRCDEDTESGVNGLSLVNGDRTFSVNATNERIRASRARELGGFDVDLTRRAVDAARALFLTLEKSRS